MSSLTQEQLNTIHLLYQYGQSKNFIKQKLKDLCEKVLTSDVVFNDIFVNTIGINEFVANFSLLGLIGNTVDWQPLEVSKVDNKEKYIIKAITIYKSLLYTLTTQQLNTIEYNNEGKIIYYEETFDFTQFKLSLLGFQSLPLILNPFRGVFNLFIKTRSMFF
jgi:hypothetical protein